MKLKNIVVAVCLSSCAVVSSSLSVGAVTASLSPAGIARPGTGATNQGTFPSPNNSGLTTFTFNNSTTPTTAISPTTTAITTETAQGKRINTTTVGYKHTYTYDNSLTLTWYTETNPPTETRLITDSTYAPKGPGGEANISTYLGVFSSPTTITANTVGPPATSTNYTLNQANFTFSQPLKSFGLNWGAVDADDRLTIRYTNSSGAQSVTYCGNGAVSCTSISDLSTNPEAEKYVYFDAGTGEAINGFDMFQTAGAGTGFEIDNVSYSTTARAVPFGVSPTLGILGIGIWGFLTRRKRLARQQKASEAGTLA